MGTGLQIPASAIAVKVTNVANPSAMKIYHEESFTENINVINEKLRLLMKDRRWKKLATRTKPLTGNMVVIQNRLELELPSWCIRGEVGDFNEKTSTFEVYLVDHGNFIEAPIEDLKVIPKSFLQDDFLTVTVGLNNLLPIEYPPKITEDGKNIVTITSKWSETAIRATRECIAVSNKLYFHYQAASDDGGKFGDLYLDYDDEIVSLSKLLVCSDLAIFCSEELKKQIRKGNEEKNIDGAEIVIDVPIKTLKTREKRCETNEPNIRADEKQRGNRRTSSVLKTKKLMRYKGEHCQQILIHSEVTCERLSTIPDARFPARIHEVLDKRMSISTLKTIQSYMWPAVSKGLNVLAVGPPNCGKTIGYVLPIVSCIASWKQVPKGNSPSILILCSSTSDVLSIQALCSELLESYTDIRAVAGYNGRENRSLVANIYNGCQIFIATPPFLVRFINQDDEHKKVLNFRNLSHLVIDGIDIVLSKYFDPLKKLLTKHVIIGKKERRSIDKPPLQIIGVARKWMPPVAEFAKQCMTDSYVCIGSYMEAAVFGCVMPQLIIVDTKIKMEKLSELIGDEALTLKTIVICSHSEEARALNEYLSQTKKTLVACEKMIFTAINGIRESWKAGISGLYPILICTDETLVDLNITDVDWLIHYSVAVPSKTQFYFRFSTVMKHLKMRERKCKVTIIMDETNDLQLHGVVDVVQRCGTTLSSGFMNNVMRIVATLDRDRKKYPICDNVKAFGDCSKKNSCPYRHCILNGIDTPTTSIAIGDSVKLTVTYVHNATHFTARVMEYISPDGTVMKYSAAEYTRTSAMIQMYYAKKSNRRYRRKNVQVGDFFAVEETVDNFKRVKVLNIVEKDYDDVPVAVELKCVDTGAILPRISVTQLMELPEELVNRDTHIVEIFLAGLSPYDDELEWNHRAINDAHKWFPDQSKPHSFVLGKVRLHLADTLWVDPLEIRTKIIGHGDMISASLKAHMVRLKHGVSNKDHLPRLYELCKIGAVKNRDGEDIAPEIFDTPKNEKSTDYVSG